MKSSTSLKDLMVKHGMSQADIAAISGRDARTVRNWLSGKTPVPTSLSLILEALDEGRVDFPWIAQKLAEGRPNQQEVA